MSEKESSSDCSSDIEILEITRESPPSIGAFLWQELCDDRDAHISVESLKRALSKYDVSASEDQIVDMILLANGNPMDGTQFDIILKRIHQFKSD